MITVFGAHIAARTDEQGLVSCPSVVRASLGRNLTYGMLDTIGRAIVTGKYEKRRFPTEAELAAQHGVSRTVTREAVKMLSAKGLLSARPRQGTIVQPLSHWNLFDNDLLGWLLERKNFVPVLRHFQELRLAIEPAAAALAASRKDINAEASIRAGYDRMVAAEAGEDDALNAAISFHIAVLQGSHNPFFVQFEELVTTALRMSYRDIDRQSATTAALFEHCAVSQAIGNGDQLGARRAMEVIISPVLSQPAPTVASGP